MLLLALDASTKAVAVALARVEDPEEERREVVSEVSASGSGASESLLRSVDFVLGVSGEEISSVERILVGVGPGTFTGIRIAASTARSLALGSGATLSKNTTLAALAAPALDAREEVIAVLDARRKEVFAQRFSRGGERGEIFCLAPDALAGALEGISGTLPLVVGDGAMRYRNELESLGEIPPDPSPLHSVSAAGHVRSAELAPVGAEEVVPLYVRKPDAEARRDLNPWLER